MATESESYLVEIYTENANEFESYKNIKSKVNSNGLLNSYKEVEDFINTRKELLKQGVELEDYWEPFTVRLSLVSI